MQTEFRSLNFDPYSNATGTPTNTSGVTRLAFSNPADGAEVVINSTSAPIYFTLPPVGAAEGTQGRCQFWSASTQRYSAVGCSTLASPLPANHTASFVTGGMNWTLAGTLMAQCALEHLDCSQPRDRLRVLLLDPYRPLTSQLRCGNATSGVIRAFSGEACLLGNASSGCAWNATLQAFAGAGCIAAPVTGCACLHLTDFASSSAPTLPTASLADMVSFSALDIVNKLRTLLIICCALFGATVFGGALTFRMDVMDKHRVMGMLKTPDAGFVQAKDGTWLWRFHLLPLDVDLAAPAGSAVVLSAIMGIPFVRLRSVLPDEFWSAPVGATFGRRTSLSLSGLAEQAPHVRVLLKSESGNATGGSPMKRATSFSDAESGAETPRLRRASVKRLSAIRSDVVNDAMAQQHERLEELLGTALVLAFLQTAQFMPTVEHARRLAAATRYFEDVRTQFGRGFRDVHSKLLVCLGPGVLDSRENWWSKARVLRLMFSQSPAGYWDANTTSALSLQARPRCEVLALRGGLMDVLQEMLASPLVMAVAGLLGFGGHDHHAKDRGHSGDGAGSDASAPNKTSVQDHSGKIHMNEEEPQQTERDPESDAVDATLPVLGKDGGGGGDAIGISSVQDHDGELSEEEAQQEARDQDSHRKPAVALCWTRVLDNDVFDGAADGAIGRSSADGITIAAGDSRGFMVHP